MTADNTTDGVVITITDISEINENKQTDLTVKKLQEDLVRLKDRCTVMKNTGLYAFWTWNIIDDAITGDTKFYNILGYQAEEISRYEDFIKIIHPEDVENLRDQVSQGLDCHEVVNFSYRVKQKEGGEVLVKSNGIVRFDDLANPVEWVGALFRA